MGKFLDKLKFFKSSLFLNGDWLYVTFSYKDQNVYRDINEEFLEQKNVEQKISIEDPIILERMYDRTLIADSNSKDRANIIRDKAKALLGTATFLSAILFGISAYFVPIMLKYNFYIIIIESILLVLMFSHFARSLFIGMDVLIRDVTIEFSSLNILEMQIDLIEMYKRNIAILLSCIANTEKHTTTKLNNLTLGQESFKYGLFYLIIIFLFHNSVVFFTTGNLDNNNIIREINIIQGKIDSTNIINLKNEKELSKLKDTLKFLKKEISNFNTIDTNKSRK